MTGRKTPSGGEDADETRMPPEASSSQSQAETARRAAMSTAETSSPRTISPQTASSQTAARFANEGPGSTIGRYTLIEEIGAGGFGAVFLAEQREPVVRRVALKIIRLGRDNQQVIARFEQERQALALMDHPHIAKVLDAGTTGAGRPFFVMELVTGEPITAFCDAQTSKRGSPSTNRRETSSRLSAMRTSRSWPRSTTSSPRL